MSERIIIEVDDSQLDAALEKTEKLQTAIQEKNTIEAKQVATDGYAGFPAGTEYGADLNDIFALRGYERTALSLLRGRATAWDLRRIGRFLPFISYLALASTFGGSVIQGISDWYQQQYEYWDEVRRRDREEEYRKGLIP